MNACMNQSMNELTAPLSSLSRDEQCLPSIVGLSRVDPSVPEISLGGLEIPRASVRRRSSILASDLGSEGSAGVEGGFTHQNQAKKLDLAERIRMHRSRASGASDLSRYGLFCMALWCTLFLLVNGLEL